VKKSFNSDEIKNLISST